MNLDYLRRFAVNQSLFAPPAALASRADRKFTFLPLQAGSDDVVPKSASWKARFWIEQLRRVWHSPSCRSSCSASADRPCTTSGGIPQKCDFLQLYWRSTCQLTRRPACSGLTYSGVPTNAPTRVNIGSAVRFWDSALAIPKSIIFGRRHAIYFHD